MSLRTKLLLFMALLALVPLILFGITASIVSTNNLVESKRNSITSLSDIEHANLENALDSVNRALADIQRNLARPVRDYANWSDLHDQVTADTPDQEWIKTNFSPEQSSSGYNSFNLNVLGIWDKSNKLIFQAGPTEDVAKSVNDLLQNVANNEEPLSTLISLGNDVYIVSVAAVRTSDITDPQGAILFGRKLGPDDMNQIKALTSYDIALYKDKQLLASTADIAPSEDMLSQAAAGDKAFDQTNEKVALAYEPLQNSAGLTMASIVISRPRNTIITAQQSIENAAALAQDTITRSLLLWAVVGGVLAVAVAFMLGNTIANPLLAMANTADKIAGGDLTQRVKAPSRDELGRLAHAFNQMADKLGTRVAESESENVRLQAIDEFRLNLLTMITQSFQTPINTIKSHTSSLDMALYGTLNDTQKRSVASISRAVSMQEALLADLLDFARAQQGQLRIVREQVSLPEIVREAYQETKEQYTDKNIQFVPTIPDSLPTLWADRIRMQQVLDNLIGSALNFTVPNGRIELTAWAHDNTVEVAITDTSKGLSPEEQARIFELFYQPATDGKPTNGNVPKNYLGLAFVKALIEQQGGTVRVEVQPEKGNTFTFTIPTA